MAQVPYYLRLFRTVHTTLQQFDSQVVDDFEVEYRRHYSNFDMSLFLADGTVSEQHALLSLQRTCKYLSHMYSEQSTRARDDASIKRLNTISTMLWNPLMSNMFEVAPTTAPVTSQSQPKHQTQPKPRHERRSTPVKEPVYDKTAILQQLVTVRSTCKGARLVSKDCQAEDCVPCGTMFDNAYLTSCADLQCKDPCTPSGWYPHVSNSSWKKLKGPHDAARRNAQQFVWKSLPIPKGVRSMPNPLRQSPSHKTVPKETASTSTSLQPTTTDDTQPPSPGLADWNDIIDAEIAANDYIIDDDEDDYAPVAKLSVVESGTPNQPMAVRTTSPAPEASASVDGQTATTSFATVVRKRPAVLFATRRRPIVVPQL